MASDTPGLSTFEEAIAYPGTGKCRTNPTNYRGGLIPDRVWSFIALRLLCWVYWEDWNHATSVRVRRIEEAMSVSEMVRDLADETVGVDRQSRDYER